MVLQGINFGRVWGQSGVQGFFGEGYWFHKLTKQIGCDFSGATFVAKTMTLEPHAGNLPPTNRFTLRSPKPKAIIVKPFHGAVLNAVGLSNPGAKALLETGRWQERTKPFFLSFAPAGDNSGKRVKEFIEFTKLLQQYLPGFKAPIGLQLNLSCPNTEDEIVELKVEAGVMLTFAEELGIPIVPKFAVAHPVELVKEIVVHPGCAAYCISNSVPWGRLPFHIRWRKIFGKSKSPLEKYGGGGLSGKPLLPLVRHWIKMARKAGITKPVCAGGGILSTEDAFLLFEQGAHAVSVGSVAILRPWKVKKIITDMNDVYMARDTLLAIYLRKLMLASSIQSDEREPDPS